MTAEKREWERHYEAMLAERVRLMEGPSLDVWRAILPPIQSGDATSPAHARLVPAGPEDGIVTPIPEGEALRATEDHCHHS